MRNSLWPHGLQHTRLRCPSPSPRVCSNSCPLSQWCHPTFSSSIDPFLPSLNLSQHQGLFQCVGSSHQVAKVLELQFHHQSFNEYSELISFRIDLLSSQYPCCPKESQESSSTPQVRSISSLVLGFLYGPTLTSIHDYWKNHSFD